MLNKSRVAGSIDAARLANLVRGPGVDTRTWVSLALALGESHVDPGHGVFVDVQLVPTEEEYTARVAPRYAGNGFGMYGRIHKDDELVVVAPSGDPAEGMVAMSILWSAIDKPPQLAVDNPEDFVLVVEPDKNLRIQVAGGGSVVIDCQDVRLGGEDPSNRVARDDRVERELQVIVDAIKGATVGSADGGALFKSNIVLALNDPVGDVGSDTSKVE